jgi:hypothetical protein
VQPQDQPTANAHYSSTKSIYAVPSEPHYGNARPIGPSYATPIVPSNQYASIENVRGKSTQVSPPPPQIKNSKIKKELRKEYLKRIKSGITINNGSNTNAPRTRTATLTLGTPGNSSTNDSSPNDPSTRTIPPAPPLPPSGFVPPLPQGGIPIVQTKPPPYSKKGPNSRPPRPYTNYNLQRAKAGLRELNNTVKPNKPKNPFAEDIAKAMLARRSKIAGTNTNETDNFGNGVKLSSNNIKIAKERANAAQAKATAAKALESEAAKRALVAVKPVENMSKLLAEIRAKRKKNNLN